jgi:protein SCO1/2
MQKLVVAAACTAIAGMIGGLWYVTGPGAGGDQFADCRTSRVAGNGALGGEFNLTDHRGMTVTDKDVFTKPALLYYGYTFCPDICPFDMARNADAIDVLAEMGYDVAPLFVSVDPRRDTQEVLADYVDMMHPDLIAMTGTEEQVKQAAEAFRVYYRVPETDDDSYLVDHMTFTYLVLPEHGFVDFFRRDLSPEQIAEQTACFIDAA